MLFMFVCIVVAVHLEEAQVVVGDQWISTIKINRKHSFKQTKIQANNQSKPL